VCGKLTTPQYARDLVTIQARMSRKIKVMALPQTFVELLGALTKSDSAHFEAQQERSRLLAGRGKPSSLPFAGAFALKKLLGLKSPATKFGPKDFENWFRIVIRAKSREELIEGTVMHPVDSRKTYRLNPAEISRQTDLAKHKKRLKLLQNSGSPILPDLNGAQVWHVTFGGSLQKKAIRFHQGLDAAYEYDKELRRCAAQTAYNFDRWGLDGLPPVVLSL